MPLLPLLQAQDVARRERPRKFTAVEMDGWIQQVRVGVGQAAVVCPDSKVWYWGRCERRAGEAEVRLRNRERTGD